MQSFIFRFFVLWVFGMSPLVFDLLDNWLQKDCYWNAKEPKSHCDMHQIGMRFALFWFEIYVFSEIGFIWTKNYKVYGQICVYMDKSLM